MARDQLILGTRKGLIQFERLAGGWKLRGVSHLGVPVPYAVCDPRHNLIFACLAHGHWGSKLQRSRDDGVNWEEIPAPAYPAAAEIRPGKPAVTTYQWCLEPGGEDQPGRMYIGTEPGGLFVSDDLGDSFQLVESLWRHPSREPIWMGGGLDEAAIHSIMVDPRDSDHVLVGVSVAGVFGSRDGLKTWTPLNRGLRAEYLPDPDVAVGHDPHLLVQCRQQPDVLWQQNHCGIFRSADGGQNWQSVSQAGSTAHFGFAVAVDPADGDRAWVVPAVSDEVRVAVDRKLCVCRSEDGGASWQTLSEGLPQENCFDFAFRHALDIDERRLALGTVGGCLYVSDDRGESWTPVTEHLPPIYSVRFA